MKNQIKHLFLFVIVLLLTSGLTAHQNNSGTDKSPDFSKEPVKAMAEIYSCYHNWKIDRGLALAAKAIAVIDKIHADDKNAVIKDPSLKLNKAFYIKSTLYTLAGMLYYRKSLENLRKHDKQESAFIMEKLKKGETVTEKDFEALAKKVEAQGSGSRHRRFLSKAREAFTTAIETDAGNPSPHFQMAGVYKSMSGRESEANAERHYFEAARLSHQAGETRSVERAMAALRSLNPGSPYIKRLEDLIK